MDSFALSPGIATQASVNLRRLGTSYADVARTAVVNPANPRVTDRRVYDRTLGFYRLVMSGVSRDCAGAPLGSVRVMLFTTGDNRFVQETTSDGSGNWSMDVRVSGPFFLVEYKAGSPDQAGTSVNTLLPVQV